MSFDIRKEADPEADMSRTVISDITLDNEKDPKNSSASGLNTLADFDTQDKYLVTLDPDEDPKNLPEYRKWLVVAVIAAGAFCATSASSMAAFTEPGVEQSLHVGHEVTILGVSLFVLGLGTGPLVVGPLSEMYGRNMVYRVSYLLFFSFTWPVAFAKNISVYLIFRFLGGASSSAFLSVAGGSVGDMFTNDKIASPMALYTISPFIGPVIGPLVTGFIVQNVTWRWTYRVLLIWQFVQIIALFLFVPETYEHVLLRRKAQRLRKETGNSQYYAAIEQHETNIFRDLLKSCSTPFKLLLLDRMALLLDLWNAVILGILYLAFQVFPIIFEGHHFNTQMTGLTFLGIGLGMVSAIASQPFWNNLHQRKAAAYPGAPPPELRLIPGILGGILVPLGLFWLAFTTYPHINFIAPIIASIPFGAGVLFAFTSTFTYLVTAYRPIAASAMAGNASLRSVLAASFPLFAGQMYGRLGLVGATCLLAGITTVMAPLPYIFYKYGARLREKSPFAVHS